MSDERVTDAELLAAYDKARGAYLIAHTGGGFDIEPYAAAEAAARARVLARMSSGWHLIETAPKDGRVVRVARDMGDSWGWVLGTARWAGSGFVSGWVARGVGGPADGLGLAHPTHWAEFSPPTPTTTQGACP